MGKWTQPVLATLIIVIVSSFSQVGSSVHSPLLISTGSLVMLFIGANMQYGFDVGILRFNRGRESTVNEMFSAGFKEDYGRVLGIVLLTALYTILWTLLFVIPGIIKAYSYGMTNLIAEDNPELGPNECIERSMAMMEGHKMELFLLDLSYIGWIMLGIITCGIGLLWVIPWMQMAHVKFYEQLKAETAAA
jgi:uncharacterized membrane protein